MTNVSLVSNHTKSLFNSFLNILIPDKRVESSKLPESIHRTRAASSHSIKRMTKKELRPSPFHEFRAYYRLKTLTKTALNWPRPTRGRKSPNYASRPKKNGGPGQRRSNRTTTLHRIRSQPLSVSSILLFFRRSRPRSVDSFFSLPPHLRPSVFFPVRTIHRASSN